MNPTTGDASPGLQGCLETCRRCEHLVRLCIKATDDRTWVAPLDGEEGGTWVGVNNDGAAVCLLNGYHSGDLDLVFRDDVPSRGEIIPRLMALSGREVEGRNEWSPRMTRSFSATRSVTLLEVDWSTHSADLTWWSRVGRGPIDPLRADRTVHVSLKSGR